MHVRDGSPQVITILRLLKPCNTYPTSSPYISSAMYNTRTRTPILARISLQGKPSLWQILLVVVHIVS